MSCNYERLSAQFVLKSVPFPQLVSLVLCLQIIIIYTIKWRNCPCSDWHLLNKNCAITSNVRSLNKEFEGPWTGIESFKTFCCIALKIMMTISLLIYQGRLLILFSIKRDATEMIIAGLLALCNGVILHSWSQFESSCTLN